MLEVHTEHVSGATVVRPEGEIDLGSAPELRNSLRDAQQAKPDKLVVDLTEVPYMDSSGVATLVEAMQMSRKNGGALVLCCMQDRVRSIFEIARLDMVFQIVQTRDEALT